MPTERNTKYSAREVARLMQINASLAYAKVAVDSMSLREHTRENTAILRDILKHTIPEYYHGVPNKIKKLLNYEVPELEKRCRNLLSRLEQYQLEQHQ